MSFLAWKLVHIAAVVLFLGNIYTGLFWASRARKTGNLEIIASTFDNISRSDRLFTVPAVIAIVVSGIAMAISMQLPVLRTGWVLWPIVLFSLSGVVFGIWIVPLQQKIAGLKPTTSQTGQSWETFVALFRSWEIWGFVALAAPLVALGIMVLKPSLPGL